MSNEFKVQIVVAYSCGLGEKGTIISRHKSYAAAERALKKSGYDSFLAIKFIMGK